MKWIIWLTKVLAWLQIVASPLLLTFIIGFVIYLANPNKVGIIIAISITLTGLITGIFWARKIERKERAVDFISRINASPELNKEDNHQ